MITVKVDVFEAERCVLSPWYLAVIVMLLATPGGGRYTVVQIPDERAHET